MPEGLLAERIVELDEYEVAVALERPCDIPLPPAFAAVFVLFVVFASLRVEEAVVHCSHALAILNLRQDGRLSQLPMNLHSDVIG